ncbi:acyltransferase-domain-containing protein [Rhizophagus clarus]|uniref:Acyltransferase-domain-containing protein n=1 Tax=Rhizophagus clarus TaxID=94130 RepID=A0A8H3M8C2_9GLOM|nr:acyltransferase-domain-containing protein [Rhizophagus clarus]
MSRKYSDNFGIPSIHWEYLKVLRYSLNGYENESANRVKSSFVDIFAGLFRIKYLPYIIKMPALGQPQSQNFVQWLVRTAVFVVFFADKSAEGVLKQSWNGAKVELDMPERLILIANHQIYADWLYVWCFTYLANAHDGIKIILKDSLKWLPIFGWVRI